MIKAPYISEALEKKHPGEVVISLDGKILGIGENTIIAVENAKKVMPDIEEKEFLVSRIPNGHIRI